MTAEQPLLVQVGDIITQGHGDYSRTAIIAWTNRDHPQPVDAIWLVPPVGDGQFTGTAATEDFMTYLGWLNPTDEEIEAAGDNEHEARDGHTWQINAPGYRHVTHEWWNTFRHPEGNPE